MNLNLARQLLLYAIPCEKTEFSTLLRQVEEALDSGVTFLQLREKSLEESEYLRRALAVKRICERYGVPFVVDDSINVALHSGADGVHIGQDDIDVLSARRILGAEKIIGVSAKTVEQAQKAEIDGADYLGVGAIYSTQTKKNVVYTSIDSLKNICNSVSIPVVAIGGIKLHNMEMLKGSGIVGVSIVTGIFSATDIRKTTHDIRLKADELFGLRY